MFRKVVLVYHSIGSKEVPAVIGAFPISLDRFKSQINLFRINDWDIESISNIHKEVSKNTVYIMSDDGTVDWCENVLPWCEKEGIITNTALITGPWLENPIYPIAHRVQIALMMKNRKFNIPKLSNEQKSYIDKMYAHEQDETRRYVKGCCNLLFDFKDASKVLDFNEEGYILIDNKQYLESDLLKQRFAKPEAYKKFKYAEYSIHTVTHKAFTGDTKDYIENEIIPCKNIILEEKLNLKDFFVLPIKPMFGAKDTDLIQPLKDIGIKGMFTNDGEWDKKSFIIERIDAKNIENYFQF